MTQPIQALWLVIEAVIVLAWVSTTPIKTGAFVASVKL